MQDALSRQPLATAPQARSHKLTRWSKAQRYPERPKGIGPASIRAPEPQDGADGSESLPRSELSKLRGYL